MVRRIAWFSLGAGATVVVVVKVRGLLRSATPAAIGQRVAVRGASVSESVRDFVSRARAAAAEREAELRDAIGLPQPPA